MTKIILYIVGIAVAIILFAYLIRGCAEPTNNSATGNLSQVTEQFQVNDSTRGIKQDVLITSDPNLVAQLQDSIQRLLNKEIGLKPTTIIQWKERYISAGEAGRLQDSLSLVIDDLLAKSRDTGISPKAFEEYKRALLTRKIPYKIETMYRKETGTIDYKGNIVSDSLTILSEPLVTVGTIKKNIFSRPTYTISIGNKNPLIQNSEAKSIVYVPPVKTEWSIGPMGMTNGKSTSVGAGLFIKRGHFSVALGYTIYNK